MHNDLFIAATLVLFLAATIASAEEKGPVLYAPDVVGVDRMFMAALKAPTDAPDVQVTLPDGVVMFDHMRPPFKSDVRKFYFRASKPAKRAEIRFALTGGEVAIPIEVWSFEDLRQFCTLKGVQLPRRWPLGKPLPELKEAQVFPTGAEEAQKGTGTFLPNGGQKGASPLRKETGGWLGMSDDDIWAMQPDSTIPRWHWVNIQYGCPTHGQDIYKKKAYYPWGEDTSFPWKWKIKCPVGGELYPSNDFGHGDMTSGDFPDDGIGGGFVQGDKHYGFIAQLCQAYCHRTLSVAPACAEGYVRTGDLRYVHKALVAMCRMAVEYAYLATMTQHRHRNRASQVERLGQGRFDEGPCLSSSGLTVYGINQPGYQVSYAKAYDQIFPAIDKDPDIIPFLRKKGFDVKTHEDVRRFIEENLIAVWMQAAMDLSTHSNEPYHQWGLAKMAEVLNYKQGGDFMDWLYDGEGKMRVFVPNTYFRDGAPYESTGGYNGMHVVALGPIVEAVEHLRALRPEAYPEEKYPSLSKSRRYHNVFDFCMDSLTIDRAVPQIGDSGSWAAYKKLPKIAWHDASAEAFEHAYRLFRDPKFAWALAHEPGWKPKAEKGTGTFLPNGGQKGASPLTCEEIEREAAKWPDDWNDRSSLHDGYGIAILRGGKGDWKRALWMNYGHNRGHSQDDALDIGLEGFEGILLSHMGYPRNWGYWEYSWSSHNVARQFPYQVHTAQAQLFADAGLVHVAEARSTSLNEPEDFWQRRMLALVDVADDRFYCVDLHRVFGGEEHWWAFHAQEGDFTTSGITLTKQEGGTLAGPSVPYGDKEWLKANGCRLGGYGWSGVMFPFAHLYNVERGRPSSVWRADWKLKTGDGLHLRLTVPIAENLEVAICDGTSPAGGHPYEMKWIMMHARGAKPVKSQALRIIEPYLDEPIIKEAAPVKLTGEDESGYAPMGCVLRLADRTDTILASADASVRRTTDTGLTFAGRFGFYSEKDGRPVAMSLIGGTELTKGEFGLRLESPEYRAKIVKLDRATETVTVSPAPPSVSEMVGEYIFVTNPVRRSAYKVLEAKAVPEGAALSLDLDSRIGTGKVAGVGDYEVKTQTPFNLQGFRYYLGARLVNADRTAEYRITEVAAKRAALIDKACHPEAKAGRLAKEFAQGSWFEVYDYGLGDEVVWPHHVSLTRTGPRTYGAKGSGSFAVVLPPDCRWERLDPSSSVPGTRLACRP